VNIAALVISALAMLFTLFSFWWMHWRRGKTIVGPPRSFAATSSGKGELLMVQLPLVFYNNGAASQVVQNLRLSLVQNQNRSAVLYFNNTVPDLANANTLASGHASLLLKAVNPILQCLCFNGILATSFSPLASARQLSKANSIMKTSGQCC